MAAGKTREPDTPEECRRQGQVVAKADPADPGLFEFMAAALAAVDGGTAKPER